MDQAVSCRRFLGRAIAGAGPRPKIPRLQGRTGSSPVPGMVPLKETCDGPTGSCQPSAR